MIPHEKKTETTDFPPARPSGDAPRSDSPFGRLTINLGAVTANHDLFRKTVGSTCDVAAVVKADAYGLGMVPVAQALHRHGTKRFFVATPGEAFALRAALPDAAIAVLGDGLPEAGRDFIESNIDPVLNSLHDIDLWSDLAAQTGKHLPAIIHVDTGMNRLGLSAKEADTLIRNPGRLESLDVKIVMSHFACADEKDHPLTPVQYERFKAFAEHFPQAQKSLANSSGMFRSPDYHFDMVRPGIASYGGNPTPETTNPMKPVVTLEARILQIRQIEAGDTIGYSATHRFDQPAVTATVGLGYADGFHRAHSGKAHVYWRGVACPLVGRVSMDLVTVDISHLKDNMPRPGDWFEVLGPHQDADQLAASAGTICYEVLTNLGKRYKRTYLSDM